MFAIKGLKLDGTELQAVGVQAAFCFKPTMQSWDFNEGEEVRYSNLGIDTIKFSYIQGSIAELEGKVVGDTLNLSLFNDLETLSSTFVIRDIAVKNGYVVITCAPVLGAEIAEEASE